MDTTANAERLEIRDAEGKIARVELAGERVGLGRAEDADVRLDHAAVSRRHAELARDPFGRWWVRDLKSRNGTKVNGVPVDERVLGYDDRVEIGPFALRLRPAGVLITATGETATTTAPVGDPAFEHVTSLGDIPAPALAAEHLDVLGKFSRRLRETPEPLARVQALCELAVSPAFRGRLAALMRVAKDRPAAAEVLCGPVCAPGFDCRLPWVSRAIVRALVERNQPVLGSNVPRDADALEITLSPDVLACAALACPIGSDERAAEFLYVLLPAECGTGEWLALMSLAAQEFREAEMSWLSRRQSAEHARIEKELDRAREVQRRLMPRDVRVPGLDVAIGFEPCRWVGGDYVDVVGVADGRTLLLVGDVCGKGPQAALIASEIHGRIHAEADAGSDLVAILGKLNGHLLRFLPPDSFATMVCVLVDPRTGALDVVNAGHPPAMVLGRTGEVRSLQAEANLPLGLAAGVFECERGRLAPDEMLVLVSDGVADVLGDPTGGIEAMSGKLCAARASAPALDAGAMAAKINILLKEAQPAGLADDDRTFLVARRC